jgi:hypothetical protein
MRPEHGGRIELKLQRAQQDRVTYALSLATESAEWSGFASVTTADGAIELSVADAALPAWLSDFARSVLRTLYRAGREGAGWPRRVARWRAEPSTR